MKVYLDYLFLENVLINYILLCETEFILKTRSCCKRKLISSLIGATYILILVIFKIVELNYILCKVLLAIFMIYIAFKPNNLKNYCNYTLIFFLVSVINVGSVNFVCSMSNMEGKYNLEKIYIYFSGFILGKISLKYIWKIYKTDILENTLTYKVNINIGKDIYEYKAFLDTGNNVFCYTENIPILFAKIKEKNMLEKLESLKKVEIQTITISGMNKKTAYVFDSIEILRNNKSWKVNAGVVFESGTMFKKNGYDMLLNYDLYVEKLGGIRI